MTNAQMPADKGWYPDPFQAGTLLRFFDGARWSDKTRPIPADYNAAQANEASAPTAPKEKPKAPAAASPKPPQFTEPAQTKKPSSESRPAKSGTAPMFKSPTATAARPEDVKSQEKKPSTAAKPPAFPKPTVSALREDEVKETTPAAAPEAPTLEPKKKFQFSKPAPTAGGEKPEQPKPNFAPRAEPSPKTPTPQGPPGEASVDDDFEENSDTVNQAFASTPGAAEYESEPAPEKSRKAGKLRTAKFSMPQMGDWGETLMKYQVPKWVGVAFLAVLAIGIPIIGPDATKSVAAECRPISQVVASYDGEEDFSVTPEVQADLAAAVSTGQLNTETTELLTQAVENNDLEPLVTKCLPQE